MARGIAVPAFVFKRNVYGNNSGSGSIAAAVTGRRTTSAEYLAALHDVPVAEQLGGNKRTSFGGYFPGPLLGFFDSKHSGRRRSRYQFRQALTN